MVMLFGQIPSLCAVVLAAGAGLYLVLHPPADRREWPLLLALFCTASIELLDQALHHAPANLLRFKPIVFFCEALLPACWGVYAAQLSEYNLFRLTLPNLLFWTGNMLLPFLALIPGIGAMIHSPDFAVEPVLFFSHASFYFYLLLSLLLLTALLLLERAFATLARRDRWRLKFEILGLGAIITMQLVYYSQGFLHQSIDMALMPARAGAVSFGLLLFFYSRLSRRRPAQLALSHAATFRSVIFLTVCSYLIVIGLASEGLRYLDPSSSRVLVYNLALVGGVALCALILSESLRRKTRVFLHKHFFRQKYDYRVLWMEITERLRQACNLEGLYTAILDMYCRSFAITSAALYLDQGKGVLQRAATLSGAHWPDHLAPSGSLLDFFSNRQWVFNLYTDAAAIDTNDVEQLRRDGIHFIIPLFFDRTFNGVIALGRQINTSDPITYEDYDLMKIFARQAAAVLYAAILSRQLAEQREMAAVGKVVAFVTHDLKNLMTNLSLVVENAHEMIRNPRFQDDMLETLTSSVHRMDGLIERLKHVGEANRLVCERCSLKQLVRDTVEEIGSNAVRVCGDDITVVVDRAEIEKVITNLVRNSLEASHGTTGVELEIVRDGGPLLVCRDQGCGMSETFISTNLFHPFETTKPQGLGIGLYQCRQIIEAHGGRIEVASKLGWGSEFRVYLPGTAHRGGVADGEIADYR